MGGKGCWHLSNLRDGNFGMHANGSRERAYGPLILLAYSPFNLHGLGSGNERGVGES